MVHNTDDARDTFKFKVKALDERRHFLVRGLRLVDN